MKEFDHIHGPGYLARELSREVEQERKASRNRARVLYSMDSAPHRPVNPWHAGIFFAIGLFIGFLAARAVGGMQ